MHVRPSLLFSLLVPSALLAGSAVAATRSGSNSTACLPASLPATGTATAPAASAGETATPAGLVFGDVDGDGLDDAFVVGAEGQARLLMNFGEGRFEDLTLAANLAELGGASCALFADLDGDGRVDLFTGSSATRLWRNLGNATFEPMPSGIEHDLVDLAAQAVDHDQDGRLDLLIHTEAGDLVYRNLGEGRFERVELPLGDKPQAPAHVGWSAPDAVDPLAAPDAATLAERRLGRWTQGRAVGGFESAAMSSAAGTSSFGPSLPFLATCQPGVRDANGGACIGASSVPTLGKLLPLNDKFWVDPATRFVDIGGMSPFWPLTVDANGDGIVQRNTDEDIVVGSYAGGGTGWFGTYTNHPLGFFVNYGASPAILIDTSGHVGIGTSAPATTFALDVEDIGSGINWKGAIAAGGSTGQKVVLGQLNGIATIGGHNGALSAWTNLDIAGEDIAFKWNNGPGGNAVRLSIDGSTGLVSVKQSLEIRGGADIVERFSSSCGVLEPGTVVAIDPENPGQLACSFMAYDTKVAGVVSGAGGVKPGICLGQDGVLDGETPVAMTGRVYVKCSTENGAIRPGDRLTTATLAGHAMKVTDSARADGAVIGKAMSALDEGTGLVLVLVNLQ